MPVQAAPAPSLLHGRVFPGDAAAFSAVPPLRPSLQQTPLCVRLPRPRYPLPFRGFSGVLSGQPPCMPCVRPPCPPFLSGAVFHSQGWFLSQSAGGALPFRIHCHAPFADAHGYGPGGFPVLLSVSLPLFPPSFVLFHTALSGAALPPPFPRQPFPLPGLSPRRVPPAVSRFFHNAAVQPSPVFRCQRRILPPSAFFCPPGFWKHLPPLPCLPQKYACFPADRA